MVKQNANSCYTPKAIEGTYSAVFSHFIIYNHCGAAVLPVEQDFTGVRYGAERPQCYSIQVQSVSAVRLRYGRPYGKKRLQFLDELRATQVKSIYFRPDCGKRISLVLKGHHIKDGTRDPYAPGSEEWYIVTIIAVKSFVICISSNIFLSVKYFTNIDYLLYLAIRYYRS